MLKWSVCLALMTICCHLLLSSIPTQKIKIGLNNREVAQREALPAEAKDGEQKSAEALDGVVDWELYLFHYSHRIFALSVLSILILLFSFFESHLPFFFTLGHFRPPDVC